MPASLSARLHAYPLQPYVQEGALKGAFAASTTSKTKPNHATPRGAGTWCTPNAAPQRADPAYHRGINTATVIVLPLLATG
jgi:hypothetical protein